MKLSANVVGGSLKILKDIEAYNLRLKKGVSAGMSSAISGLQRDLRQQTEKAGLGRRVSNAWRRQVFPKGKLSMNAAGSVWSKAPHIIAAFDQAVTISPKTGKYLAIPTENVIRRNNRKLTPDEFEEAGIPLRYVAPKSGRRYGILVADNFRINSKGKARLASNSALRTGKGLSTVVMYVLVPETRMKKKLDIVRAAKEWHAALGSEIDKNMAGING